MSVPCCWCGADLNVGGRVSLMRHLTCRSLPAIDPKAVIPVYPPAQQLQFTVSCARCRSTVTVPADFPEASA